MFVEIKRSNNNFKYIYTLSVGKGQSSLYYTKLIGDIYSVACRQLKLAHVAGWHT